MHKSRLGTVVIDCRTEDLPAAARFWSEALGYELKADGESEDDRYIELECPPDELKVILQKVDHESRVHLDIESDDIEAEVRRLEGLGARRIAAIESWVVLEAPSGQRFCVVRPQRPDFAARAKPWA
jgi:catechol 2,3-dioxygenase-like lactoylglutathione lyase family enzyme